MLGLDTNPKTIETGENVLLAVIDQGFDGKNAAFFGKEFPVKGDTKFTVDFESENPRTKGATLAGYRQHGTAVAAIAFGRRFDGHFEKKKLTYEGGIAQRVKPTCYSYKKTNAGAPLPKTNTENSGVPKSSLGNCLPLPPGPPPPPPPPLHSPHPKCLPDDISSILEIFEEIRDAQDKIDVVCMSVCMEDTDRLNEVINVITEEHGTLIFAGTDDRHRQMGYPARLPSVISVGSLPLPERGQLRHTWDVEPKYCDVYTFGEVLVPKADKNEELMKVRKPYAYFSTPAVAGLACLAIQYAKDKKIGNPCIRRQVIMSFFKKWQGYELKSAKDFLTAIKVEFDALPQ